jgi:hypothetical protein
VLGVRLVRECTLQFAQILGRLLHRRARAHLDRRRGRNDRDQLCTEGRTTGFHDLAVRRVPTTCAVPAAILDPMFAE